jgi:NADPH:quinone reductase-like Zn-dependent oxidoreductase
MKAIRLHVRGGPEQLVYEDAPLPIAGRDDALVRVNACAITPTELTWPDTYQTPDGADRLPSIPGHELCGRVTEVGRDVTDVKAGDAVYALTDFRRDGAAAEYIAVRAADLAPKPRTLNEAQSAAVTLSGLTAWQALFDHADLTEGQRILIHGAAGGVGGLAVQLACWCGAEVIATASADHAALVRELGAARVIDYTAARFENEVRGLDVVLDTVGGDTLDRSWKVLRPGGVLVTIAGQASADQAASYGVRAVDFIVKPSRAELIELARLLDAGKLRAVVEAVAPLDRARELFERGLRGHNNGKLVLQVAAQSVAQS